MLLVWAWMLWLSYALGTCTLLWVGHGCYCYRMLSEHEHYYGLGMDALVIVCSRNTSVTMVWAWMRDSMPRNTNVILVWAWSHYFWYAFGTRTFLWFGRGCAIVSMLSEPPMPLFIVCSVCSRNTKVILVWEWMHLLSYALGTRTLLWFGHGRTIFGMENERYCGLGMDALVIVCSRNTNVIMVWACMDALVIVCSRNTNVLMVWEWMHLLSYALGTRTLLWLGHGCAIVCSRNTNVIMVWEWMHLLSYALGTRTLSWFGHGRTIFGMLSEHERYSGLGMVALFIVGSVIFGRLSEHNIIMVWAWMRDSMLSEHERCHGVGMDALVIVCSQNTNVIMVWAWMLWHSRSRFLEKRDAWYTQYFGPPKHFECVVRATQATSGEVGQVCIFCASTLRRSQ